MIAGRLGRADARDGRRSIRSTCSVEASDRQGLLRDVSEVFAKEKINVTGVQVAARCSDGAGGTAFDDLHGRGRRRGAARRGAGPGLPRSRRARRRAAAEPPRGHFTGIGVARSTGTAVTLFCGEPSITRSE